MLFMFKSSLISQSQVVMASVGTPTTPLSAIAPPQPSSKTLISKEKRPKTLSTSTSTSSSATPMSAVGSSGGSSTSSASLTSPTPPTSSASSSSSSLNHNNNNKHSNHHHNHHLINSASVDVDDADDSSSHQPQAPTRPLHQPSLPLPVSSNVQLKKPSSNSISTSAVIASPRRPPAKRVGMLGMSGDVVSKTQTVSQLSALDTERTAAAASSATSGVVANSTYELSEEMKQHEIELMCRRYGGFSTAYRAACVIQARYRQYKMARNFDRLCENTLAKRRSLNNAAQLFE